jgi:hypothetical protein
VKAFQADRRRSNDHRVRQHRDEEWTKRWARSRGHTLKKGDELAARAKARDDAEKRVRTGSDHATARHDRWRRLFAEFRDEHPDASESELESLVALQDWQTHPDDWARDRYPANPREPSDFADRAVAATARDRVRKALRNKRPA